MYNFTGIMKECRCDNCNKKLGEADAVGAIILYCKSCKKVTIFNLIKEPDCLRVTAFIENNKINEKTVNNTGDFCNA